jgi:PBP1b-binding outer membrane lipoprotein LpoB
VSAHPAKGCAPRLAGFQLVSQLEDESMHRNLVTILALFMVGCGAEVASTAAVSGAARAQEAQQAQQTMDRVQQELDAAMKAAQERAAEAEKSMGY